MLKKRRQRKREGKKKLRVKEGAVDLPAEKRTWKGLGEKRVGKREGRLRRGDKIER